MKTILINKFDGGHAEDIRTFRTDQCEESLNFDIFSNPHYLQPYKDTQAGTITALTISDHKLSGVLAGVSGQSYVALGQKSSVSLNAKFFYKGTIDAAWTGGGEYSTGSVFKNTLVNYNAFAHCLNTSGSDTILLKLTVASSAPTSLGTIVGETTDGNTKPFVHPEDGLLYMAVRNVIASWDGTTFTDDALVLPEDIIITSLTDYGTYLAIGTKPAINTSGESSVTYLWGRDNTLTTTQGVIDFGEGQLQVLENLGEILVAVLKSSAGSNTFNNKMKFKIWAGGEVITIKELPVSILSGVGINKQKNKDRVFFALDNDDAIYSFGKDTGGIWTISKDRYMLNGAEVGQTINGFSIIEDSFWIGCHNSDDSDQGLFYFSPSASNYTATSIYKTTINPGMPLEDRYKDKQLMGVQIAFTGVASGTIQVKYSVDGSTMSALIPSGSGGTTTTAIEDVREITNEDDGTALLAGREFQFQIESTGGVKVKEIRYKYNIINSLI